MMVRRLIGGLFGLALLLQPGMAGAGSVTLLGAGSPPISGPPPTGPISYINAATAATTTVTISGLGIQASDLILYGAYRSASATAPTLPAGKFTIQAPGANTNSMRVAYTFATGSGDASGTWTNATQLEARVYRGVRGLGGSATSGASSASMAYPTITFIDSTSGNSWASAYGGHRTASNVGPPAGMTNTVTVGTGPMLGGFDTGAGVTSWTSASAAVNATSGWETVDVELLDHSTYDPYRKATNMTLSSGNMVATQTSNSDGTVFVAFGRNAGLFAYQWMVGTSTDGNLGLANLSLTTTVSPGDNANGIRFGDSGNITYNGSVVGTISGGFAAHDTVQMAVDGTNQRFWIRVVHSGVPGLWNGSGTANPITNTGGISISGLGSGLLVPCWGGSTSGSTYTYSGAPGILGIGDWDS